MTRDTTTGSDFEKIVEACLFRAAKEDNFSLASQRNVGHKPGGESSHKVDWELISNIDDNIRGLVSCKYQGTSGTAEEKIVYEVIKLLHTMKIDSRYKHAWIALGGEGWSEHIKTFIRNELVNWVPEMKEKVTIFQNPNELIANRISIHAK